MTKRSDRPWDKGSNIQEQLERAQAILTRTIPSIQLDNDVEYKSDQFYLHSVSTIDDLGKDNVNTHNLNLDQQTRINGGGPSCSSTCTCGAENPPPLFDREALVRSLDLEAAILGTYNLSLNWMTKAFPQLVGPTASVPTLILHGNKGLVHQSFVPKSREEVDDDDSISVPEYNDEKIVTTMPPTQRVVSRLEKESSPAKIHQEERVAGQNELDLHGACQKLHLSRILSAWTPPEDASAQRVTRESDDTTEDHRKESKRGVHHPKYMILFERSGDIVVVVSTANLTPTKTTEGSWVQRFHPQRGRRREDGSASKKKARRSPPLQNDFGRVLIDFLEKSSQSAMAGHMTVDQFLNKYMGYDLNSLDSRYHFDKAQVHLIPTVPGDFPVSQEGKCVEKDEDTTFWYGRQRVAHLLGNKLASRQGSLSSSKKDRLIVQPTSFGGNWKRSEMADVVRSYLLLGPEVVGGDNRFCDDFQALGRMDIVWPSRAFMTTLREQQCQRRSLSPKSVLLSTHSTVERDSTESSEPNPLIAESFHSSYFMSSTSFNSAEEACLSRMVMYQTSDPPQRAYTVEPHIKSVARLIRGKQRSALKQSYGPADEYISWFMLTSACLSLGAQGKSTTTTSIHSDKATAGTTTMSTVAYANFELGILFTSQLKDERQRSGKAGERLYCFRPHECSCSSSPRTSPRSKMIHLPIPYCLRPKPYLEHADDSEMVETPFFHEISTENRCVGNMLMTPYGKALANEFNDKRKSKKKLEI